MNVWPNASARLQSKARVLLLFDYDGTLTPIVSRPEDALLSGKVAGLLGVLATQPRYVVGIVSGRSLDDLRILADVPGIVHAGNHGMEIRGNGWEFVHPGAVAAKEVLNQSASELRESLGHIPGVLVEHKGLTLSVHFRAVDDSRVDDVYSTVREITARRVAGGELRLTHGKKVVEVRPDISWDKGKAIETIWRECGDCPFPVYFGDDLTDEDGFRAVQDLGGMAVFVGSPRQGTVALHQLESPEEVEETLLLLLTIA